MTEKLQMSPAIQVLFDTLYDSYDESLLLKRNQDCREAMVQYPDRQTAYQYAKGLKTFLLTKNTFVHDYDLLAGHGQYIQVDASYPVNMNMDIDPRYDNGFKWDLGREIACCKEKFGDVLTEEEASTLDYLLSACSCELVGRWACGHQIAGYYDVLQQGYGRLISRLEQSAAEKEGNRQEYVQAMLIAVKAVQEYHLRYAKIAADAAEACTDPKNKANLQRIAAACENLADKPPATFFEAVQGVWLLHEVLTFENLTGSISLGRLDQFLYPYYKKDLDEGRITREEAEELLQALWLKFCKRPRGFQNVTLGGCDSEGNDAYNDITLMCLRASRVVKLDQPLLSLRCTPTMPDEVWQEALALIAQGGGFPALFYDDAVIHSKTHIGVSLEDARNYGIVGCVELSIGGKEYSNPEELRINWSKVLEFMLSGGECLVTGTRVELLEPHDLDQILSFDELYAWYRRELAHVIDVAAKATDLLDLSYPVHFPSPMLSATYMRCIEVGEDAAATGPEYCFSSINPCGMASVVDSLLAIKEMVFDKKMLSLSQLAEVLRFNFEGHETLRAYALNKCPKFGNNTPEPNEMMADLVNLIYGKIIHRANSRGSRYQVGLYTAETHSMMGQGTGALPDGRLKGVALSNGSSPVQGMDITGPTAVINSVLSYPHNSGNGYVLDIKFTPSFFDKTESKHILRSMIETYFEGGGMEIQFNAVSRETLLAAQKEPEKYRNLVVRVSGFSAYFVMLDPVTQDEIIRRTEYHGV